LDKAVPDSDWVIGKTVPWSVSWTGEQLFELQVSKDFPGLVDLVQVEKPGVGEPRFAAQHVTRHRAGMARHVCHVCGKPTFQRDRFLFPAQTGGFVTLSDGAPRYAGNVPPVHLACANRAQTLCPHLSHTVEPPVAYPAEPSVLMPRPDVVPGMEDLAKTLPGNLKIVFSCYRLYGPKFTRMVEKMWGRDP
jgi:hypothetical protein